jgi:two-component system NtrC family sensor kinase
LEAGLARVATGDLGVRLAVARADELGRLTEHFNRMTDVLDHRAHQHGRFVAAGELIAGIAHEVNNPLMAITSVVSNRLADDQRLAPELQEELRQVLRQSQRAGKLVSGLLRFVRGGAEAAIDFDLEAVTRDAIDLVAHRFPVEEIELHYHAAGSPCRVTGNPSKIEQVLVNLLSNASDALLEMPPPRIIQMESRRSFTRVTLTFQDNGPGIPPDLVPRLFHPFVSSKGENGTGLGLYISREIARAAGGDITLEQGTLGGACFVLQLPLTVPVQVNPRSSPAGGGPANPTHCDPPVLSGASILLVDDEAAVRSPIARFLRRRGAEVVEAKDGIEGLLQVSRKHFDAILADVRMPRMDGLAFYRGLLERYPDSAARVLFLSGDISLLSGLELGGIGSGRILLKPVELAVLEARIGEVVLLHQ